MTINTWGETLNSWDDALVAADTTAPIITINPIQTTYNLTVGDSFTPPVGASTDNVDATETIIPTGSVDTDTAGTYTLTYSDTDVAGNVATPIVVTVNVEELVDVTKPVIIVTFTGSLIVNEGGVAPVFTATAFDNVDGDITGSIVESGDTINTSVLGQYTRRWNVSDSSGNAATEETRTVIVRDPLAGVPIEFRRTLTDLNSYLKTQGYNKAMNDNIKDWLSVEGFSGNLNDAWNSYLIAEGYISGSLQDKKSAWEEL